MATTTATITIASSDIADNAISVSNTSTLYTAGTDTGITETTGLGRKKFAYTPKGMAQAKSYAKKTGKKVGAKRKKKR